jgi:hypothetical protein
LVLGQSCVGRSTTRGCPRTGDFTLGEERRWGHDHDTRDDTASLVARSRVASDLVDVSAVWRDRSRDAGDRGTVRDVRLSGE